MFTGIIKVTAPVRQVGRSKGGLILKIQKPKGWRFKPGDSIAVDGTCLTVMKINRADFVTQLMPETLNKTSFGRQVPKKVNLELPLKLSDLLSGHMVLGHVDTVGRIQKIKETGSSKVYQMSFPPKFARFVVQKGSIAVDGISLTVVGASKNWFSVSVVNYTLKHTTLGRKKSGDLVNLEVDIIAKYAQR